jgi:chromosome segregation protein
MVDREGHSLYKLNEQRVTRDKIVDIVGDNEYNIILQDDVTRVIEMKPVERRVIIDDLCGIAEYDRKKARAIRELEKVEDRISETHIVLGEKQGYLIRLKKERDDALQFKSVRDELTKNKASLVNHNLKKVEGRLLKLDEKASELNREKDEHLLRARGVKEKIEVERGSLKEIGRKMLALEEGKSRSRFTELSTEIRGLEERVNALAEREAALEPELSEYSGRGRRLSAEIKSFGEEIPKAAYELEEFSRKIAHESKRASEPKLEREVEEAQMAVLELKSREKALSETIAGRKQEISLRDSEENELRNAMELSSSERVELARQIAELEEAYRLREREHLRLREALAKNKAEFEKLEKTLEEASLECTRKKTQLKTVEEAGGGVKGAVKAVMRLKDVLPGIHGIVSQVGSVSEERYEVALHVAAGGRLQNIVVDDVKVAGKCIDYLKKKEVGRATFLPLDKLNVPLEGKLPQGAEGFARDFIKTEERYRKVFEYVFWDTLVVKDLKTAEKIGVGKHRMATLEGELLEKSGALTGGHVSKSAEIGFSNLEELEREIEALNIKVARLSEQRETLLSDIVRAEAKLLDYQRLVDEKTEVEKLRLAQSRVDERILEHKKRLAALDDERKAASERIADSERELSSCEEERKSKEKAFSKLIEQRRKHDTTALDDLKRKETELKIRHSNLSERKRVSEEQLTEVNVKLTKLNEEKTQVAEEKAFKEKELETLRKEFALVEEEAATLGDEIRNLLSMREKTEENITKLSSEAAAADYSASSVSEKIQQVLVDKAKAEAELEALRQDFTEYAGVELIDAPVTQIERAIMTLERQLEDFGSINMKAIEAYEQGQKEYEEIESKLNTLKQERQSIFDFMEQVERKKYEVFMKAFNTVKENFEEIFHKISDGEGTLILDNPKEISESGLLIKASPGGKKVMNLDAMSGGEKVLTSAAFLLAIQQYKPSYFYIVDELDAALDKTNSVRLAQMLKESDAQFILVTHNNAVIKHADSVVGVSMQNGVSNIVEVKLGETNETQARTR